jgi:hypothetical protein
MNAIHRAWIVLYLWNNVTKMLEVGLYNNVESA